MEDEYYHIASNPTRRGILRSLSEGERGFSDLMRSIGMDPEHDTGVFLFHIHRLEEMGLIASSDGRYYLVEKGEEVSESISELGDKLKGVEISVAGLEIDIGSVEPSLEDGWVRINREISMKREEETGLTVDPPLPEPRTMEVYRPTGRSMTTSFPGKEYETHQCLEETVWGTDRCLVTLSKRYCTNYMGVHKHLRSGMAHINPDGYYLDNWLKVWTVPQTSKGKTRLFTVKEESWSVQAEDETPETNVYEPPQQSDQIYPLCRETATWGVRRRRKGITHDVRTGYLGEYTIKIKGIDKRCLGIRGLVTTHRNGEMFSQRVIDRFGSLWARYDLPEKHRKWGNSNWEKSPLITVQGEEFYMTEETYMANTVKY